MRKRILITSFTFPPQKNGVSHVVEAHAMGLARLGHDVTVATGLDSARTGVMWNGVNVRQFATFGNGLWGRGGYTGNVRAYQDFIASYNGDLIICHCWQIWSTDLAVHAFQHVQCPKILVSHGVSARMLRRSFGGLLVWMAWKPYLAKMPRILRKFSHVVILSERIDSNSFYDHKLMHRIGYKEHSVIPNGVSEELFITGELVGSEEFRERHGIGNRPMLLYVSNYEPIKNHKMAIEAFLKADLPDVALVLIGSEFNDYARGLHLLARQVDPTGKRIIFLEKQARNDVVSAFSAADLFICSSKWEHQPLVILEAIAAGKPYVCTDVGCVRDIPGGVVVRDLPEMVWAVRGLMADEPRRRQLGQKGQAVAAEKYTWEKVVQQYDELIEKLCSDHDTRM